jgi:UDP-N-acetylglucosamine 2-epimerase (non-hydrolysing)
MLKRIEEALLDSKPSLVVVGGDANTNLAGALATRKLGIILAHMEAGLRSYDWRMPEEHNRIIIDHISDILLPPTEQARKNLIQDNVKGNIHVVGNPIVDAVEQNLSIADKRSRILETQGLQPEEYFLCTIHREENVDDQKRLEEVIQTFITICRRFKTTICLPLHPRTRRRLAEFGLFSSIGKEKLIRTSEPLGYIDFLKLLVNCRIVLTDSGGIQEEACISKVPCVTLRESTERPETVDVGANEVAGIKTTGVLKAMKNMLESRRAWDNPFGDGKSAERIVNILEKYLRRKVYRQ